MSAGRHAAYLAAAAAGYAVLTVWLTWPLAATLTTRLPCPMPFTCTYDTLYSAWAVSWVSHALLTAPFHIGAANIYHPAPDALYYGPAGLGAVPYALPVFVATGNAAAAINTAFLSCTVLTALALHWVVWRWTGSTLAGFVAAWAFLMNRWFLWWFVAVTPHLAAIQYLPLIAFLVARPLAGWRAALLLLVLITVQCLTDPVYVAAAVLAPVGAVALARVARPAWRRAGFRLLGVLAGSVACLLFLVRGYARVRAADSNLARQSVWADSFRLFQGFGGTVPTDLTKLFWYGAQPTTTAPAILALIALGALVALLRRNRESGFGHAWCHASLWAFMGTWISLSPVASIGNPWSGRHIYLPQNLLTRFGLYQVIRAPERLGVAAMIGFCLLAGVAFAELVHALDASLGRRSSRTLAGVAAMALATFAYWIPPAGDSRLPRPYPLLRVPPTDVRMLDALRGGQGPVLELPVLHPRSKRAEPSWNALAMYRSTLHWRKLLNGYSSYWPAGFYERMQLAEMLPAASALRALVCETGLKTLIVNLSANSPNRAAWEHAATTPDKNLKLAARVPGALVFDITLPPPGPGGTDCAPFAGTSGEAD